MSRSGLPAGIKSTSIQLQHFVSYKNAQSPPFAQFEAVDSGYAEADRTGSPYLYATDRRRGAGHEVPRAGARAGDVR